MDQSSWEGKRILIVEDDDTNFLYISAILKRKKVQIIRSMDGLDAFFVCMTDAPDIVVMDIRLPILNGCEAIRLIKKYEPNVPIITLTASVMNEDRLNALNAGSDAFITKPILPNKMISVIDSFFNPLASSQQYVQPEVSLS